MTSLFEGARKNRLYVLKISAAAFGFFVLQFLYQFYVQTPGGFALGIVRASAFSAATLIGLALLAGPLAAVFKRADLIAHRRSLGVLGFLFVILHAMSASAFIFGFDLNVAYWSLNPFENPVLFGTLAYLLFLPVFLTSTDWAVQKLGARNWKRVHRLVYFAYALAVLHFANINPPLLFTPPGYLLMGVVGAVYALELVAFFKNAARKGWLSRDALFGYAIIIVVAAALYTGLVLY